VLIQPRFLRPNRKSKKSKLVIDDEVEDTDVEDEEIEAELVPNLVERGLGRGRARDL